ncbi:MAG: FecR domain-containing protein [Pseudomonadota bacterium]|nr:FecR domain-containing protein [Pseudomonadota bacterium]
MNVRQSASHIEDDAARWVMRLDREGRAALDGELQAWLAGDPRRAGALLQAEAAWSVLDRARLAGPERRRPAPFGVASPRRLVLGGLAAAAAAAVAGILLMGQPETYATTVGEVRRLPLEDGSSASINSASRLEVDFGDRLRRVRLDEGEAWFQVARDETRPFRVDAGRVRVQAVGTAFSVRRVASGVEVRVTEGRVKVWVDGASAHTVELPAGTSSFVAGGAATPSRPVSVPSEIDRELAWRSGRIDLAGETLGQAAAEFNRYNARALVIEDAALADERLYGVFRLDDPEGFAGGVAVSLGAEVSSDASTIRIDRAE